MTDNTFLKSGTSIFEIIEVRLPLVKLLHNPMEWYLSNGKGWAPSWYHYDQRFDPYDGPEMNLVRRIRAAGKRPLDDQELFKDIRTYQNTRKYQHNEVH